MKPSNIFIALFLCAAPPTLAQQAASAGAPPQTPGSMSGKVINSVTGQGVKKAVVSIRGASGRNSYATGSDESGKFALDNIQPDRYTLSAQAEGYASPLPIVGKRVTVAAQQDVSGVEVKIAPLSVISGKVVDEDGQPVEQANVIAFRFAYTAAGRRLQLGGSAQINDRGEYRIFNLAPGRYYLVAQTANRAMQFAPATQVHSATPIQEQAYAPAYYPGAGSLAEATPQEVKPGAEWTGADFKLRLRPAYHIRGRLTGSVHGGNVPTTLRAQPCGEDAMVGSPHMARQQPDGSFDVPGMVAGVYCLNVFQPGMQGATDGPEVTVKAGDVDGVEVTVGGSFVVSGRVMIDGTPPSAMPPVAIAFSTPASGGASQRGMMKSDGTFQIPGVLPGAYTILLPQGSPLYAKAVLYGSQDVTAGTIASLQPSVPLTITMGADTGNINGTVQAGNVEIGAPVAIVAIPDNDYPARPDRHRMTTGFVGSNFTLSFVPPGSYKVYAIETDDFGEASNSEFIKLLAGGAAPVTLQPNGNEQASPTVISFADVEQARRKLK